MASEAPATDLGGPVDAVRSDITVESKKIGIIIGPKGATLHGIQGIQRAHFLIMFTLLPISLTPRLNFFLHAFISCIPHYLPPFCHYYQPFLVSLSPSSFPSLHPSLRPSPLYLVSLFLLSSSRISSLAFLFNPFIRCYWCGDPNPQRGARYKQCFCYHHCDRDCRWCCTCH